MVEGSQRLCRVQWADVQLPRGPSLKAGTTSRHWDSRCWALGHCDSSWVSTHYGQLQAPRFTVSAPRGSSHCYVKWVLVPQPTPAANPSPASGALQTQGFSGFRKATGGRTAHWAMLTVVWVRVPSCGFRARSGWASCALYHVVQLPWSVPTTHQCQQQPLPTVMTHINDSRQIVSPRK